MYLGYLAGVSRAEEPIFLARAQSLTFDLVLKYTAQIPVPLSSHTMTFSESKNSGLTVKFKPKNKVQAFFI